MEKQEKKNNKALYVALAVLLVVALLAGSLGGVWYRKTRGDVLVEQSNSLHKSLAAGFTDVKITNKTSAVEAVQSVKEKLGLNDAEEELEVVGTQKINGDKYYRMQQYHKGIPVYGRNVVVGADEDGNALSLTTNYEPIGGELSTDPSVDEATVKKNIEKQLKKVSKAETTKAAKTTTTTAETTQEETTEKSQKETTKKTEKETTTEAPSEETTEEATKAASGNFLIDALEQSNLVFYDFLKKGEAVLSYALNVKDDTTGLWKAIVDAKTGEVLDMLPMTFTSTATVEDSAGNAFTASYKSAQKKYVLEDETLKTFIATFKGADSTSGAPCIIIESEDNVFGNTATEKDLDYNKAARFYRTVTKVQNRFKSLYGAKADNLLVAMYNDGNDYGNNGYASSDTMTGTPYIKDGTPIGIISIGTLKDVETIDLIAHEYMHRVEQNKVGLLYRSESGAL
ncbi:MAG: hypothetical protein IJ547_02375, partial [Clostridia bacterium]|nr:hypothetical protein [Clostridia bacterium]